MASKREQLILASASTARAALLRAAGVDFAIEPAGVDEEPLKRTARAAGAAAIDCALQLAVAKARCVSARIPDALIIGGDQVLVADDVWFDKPENLDAAREQLRALRGRPHRLATAVCVVRNNAVLWHAMSEPELWMRAFSDTFLDRYLMLEGESVLGSVGAYRLENRGVQLFARISGDHFAVLGLPLIELLGFLRERGVVPT